LTGKLQIERKNLYEKRFTLKICSKLLQHSSKKKVINNLIKKWTKVLNSSFFKDDTQMANRYMKYCSTLLIFRKLQMKSIMRYHFISSRVAIIRKQKVNMGETGETGGLVHCAWNIN
jgi:hypothetical protein